MRFISRTKKKFGHAIKGLKVAFVTENSFKAHLGFSLLVFGGGIFFSLDLLEWIAVIIAVGLVVVSELFNTAIEHLVHMFTIDYSDLAETLLNISAGAVLFASLTSFIVAVLIFGPRIFALKLL